MYLNETVNAHKFKIIAALLPFMHILSFETKYLLVFQTALAGLICWCVSSEPGWYRKVQWHSVFFIAALSAVISSLCAYFFNPYTGVLVRLFNLYNGPVNIKIDLRCCVVPILSCFICYNLFKSDKKAFNVGLKVVILLIWLGAVYGICKYIMISIQAGGLTASRLAYDGDWASNPIPAGSLMIAALFLPMFKDKKKEIPFKIVFLIGIVLTFNRSTLVALFFVVLLVLLKHRKSIPLVAKIGAVLLLVASVIGIFLLTIQKGKAFSDGYRFRQIYYTMKNIYFSSIVPLFFGHGQKAASIALQEKHAADTICTADNAYLTIIYEQGLIGILAVLLLLLRMFYFYFFDKSDDSDLKRYALAGIAVLGTFFFYEGQCWPVPMNVLAMCMAPFFAYRIQKGEKS